MITRVLDFAVLGMCAVVVLLPRPDVVVKPGLQLDPERRLRVAELEVTLLADPGEPAASLELSDLFLDAHRPDWALAIATRALDRAGSDHRLHARRALALADHFEAGGAFAAADKALQLCRSGTTIPCSETERTRLELLHQTLDRVRDLNMRQNPNAARQRIMQSLRPAFIPRPKASNQPPAASPKQPPTSVPVTP
jgi:hypothetical protein